MMTLLRLMCFILVLPLLLTHCSSSQPDRAPVSGSQSPRFESNQDIRARIMKLEEALVKTPDDHATRIRVAGLYQELADVDGALRHMEYLSDAGYREDPRLYGSLASIYKQKEEFEKARQAYQTFGSLLASDDPRQIKIEEEISDLDFIIDKLAAPDQINLRRLARPLNSGNSEYLPQFTLDDHIVIFTRRYLGQEDLLTGIKTDSGFQVFEIKELNTPQNEGAHALSADGRTLIFTKCDKRVTYGSCDLFRSTLLSDGSWSKPANMGQLINSREWDSQPTLSADGRTLYFVSRRAGGLGGADIYKSLLGEDGKWGRPINIGPVVNTIGNDESPFIHADGRTLYFRSTGHRGLGSYDIFRAQLDDENWKNVLHLGTPLNTVGNDGALVVSLDGQRGYYATDVFENVRQKHLDLFEFDLPDKYQPTPMTFIKGLVVDAGDSMPLQSSVTIRRKSDQEILGQYTTGLKGELLVAIPLDEEILYDITKEGYVFSSNEILITSVSDAIRPEYVTFKISRLSNIVEASSPIILHNIFFESGSAELLLSSQSAIDNIYTLLIEWPEIDILITGHTDDVGSDADNLLLSKKRALAVKIALVAKGVPDHRVQTDGKGESVPIDTATTEEARANNRRVEMKILRP